ncbi:MAG: TPM domain-containing protein [Acetivibrionales bacterium]|jgi:uncharacterized protein
MKRLLTILFIVLCITFVIPGVVLGQAYPEPTSGFFVNDFANVLDADTEKYIQETGIALLQKTTSQVVVVTLDSLGDEPLEDYALNLFRSWEIGDKEKDNGVLILLSVGDRASRIEVGYGLEGALPDGKTGRIQDDYMIPWFREGDYSQGIKNGYTVIVSEIYKEYGIESETEHVVPSVPSTEPGSAEEDSSLRTIILVVIGIIVLIVDWIFFGGAITRFVLLVLLSGRRGGRGGGGFGGGGFRGGGGSTGGGGSSRRW